MNPIALKYSFYQPLGYANRDKRAPLPHSDNVQFDLYLSGHTGLKPFVEIDHEIFSTVILSLPLIQEGQLSVSGERMCTILVNRLED